MLIVRDRHGATSDAMLPDLEAPTFARVMQPVVAHDALLVSDGRAAYDQFADHANGLLHIELVTSKRECTYGSYHIQNVNAYISRFKRWICPLQRRRHPLPAQLPRMAAHDFDRMGRYPHFRSHASSCCHASGINLKLEQSPFIEQSLLVLVVHRTWRG